MKTRFMSWWRSSIKKVNNHTLSCTCLWFITEVSVYSELIRLNKEKIRPNMQDHKGQILESFFIAFGGCKNPSLPLVCHRSKINLNFVCSYIFYDTFFREKVVVILNLVFGGFSPWLSLSKREQYKNKVNLL